MLISRFDIKQQLWEEGFNYFPDGSMGRLCFNSQYKGGALKRWPHPAQSSDDSYWDCCPYMDIYRLKEAWWNPNKIITPLGK